MSTTRPRIRFLTRVAIPAAILGTAAALIALTSWRALERLPEARVAPVAVIASDSAQAQASGGIQAPGWIEPAPFAIEVRALREGVVADVLALEGSRVEAGEVLVTLEQAAEAIALARQDAALRLAEAEVASKAAALRAADRTLALALDAEHAVREAEAALREAEAARAKLAASAGEVRRLALRVDALAAETQSFRSEREAREARVATMAGDLAAARTARAELIAETRARDEARASLDAAGAARDGAIAMRDEAKLAVERSAVRAPRAGIVMRRNAAPGSRVGGETDALLSLYDPASLQVRCDVPLKEAARLSIGLAAEIRVDAVPNRVLRGRIVRIVPESDLQKNTVQCKVAIDEPDPALRPDMLARVRIVTDGESRQAEAVAVPADALRSREGARGTVLVAIPDAGAARVEAREIVLGVERGNGWLEVAEGLAAGDRVVLDAAIADRARIRPLETPKEDAP